MLSFFLLPYRDLHSGQGGTGTFLKIEQHEKWGAMCNFRLILSQPPPHPPTFLKHFMAFSFIFLLLVKLKSTYKFRGKICSRW